VTIVRVFRHRGDERSYPSRGLLGNAVRIGSDEPSGLLIPVILGRRTEVGRFSSRISSDQYSGTGGLRGSKEGVRR